MKKTEEHMKGVMFSPESTLFEELGFNYIGPVDGHNIDELVATLTNMRNLKGPQLLHIKTKKVKGTSPVAKVTACCSAIATSKYCFGKRWENSTIPEPSRIAGVIPIILESFFCHFT